LPPLLLMTTLRERARVVGANVTVTVRRGARDERRAAGGKAVAEKGAARRVEPRVTSGSPVFVPWIERA